MYLEYLEYKLKKNSEIEDSFPRKKRRGDKKLKKTMNFNILFIFNHLLIQII